MSDPWLAADPVLPAPLLCGILVALTICFIWLEWKRNATYFTLRVIALIVMMLAAAGFLFRPEYQTTRSEQIILLTPDYAEAKADSLLNAYPKSKVFLSQDAEPYPNATPIRSYHDLAHDWKNVTFILGQGLPPTALDLLPPHDYQFIPSPYPTGVILLSLADNIVQHRMSTIEGVFNSPSEDTSKLILTGPGGKQDSVSFSENGFQVFKLSFLPKNAGRHLYTILSDDEVVGKIPVNVEKQRQLDILFIQHYPTFETRYLKEFLAQDHSLQLRQQLSKNKFRNESINRQAANISQLTKESLSEFDLLIIDTDALQSLRASEKNSLRSAIEEGLGLLPFLNAPPGKTNEFFPFRFKRVGSDTAHVFFDGSEPNVLPAWPFDAIPEGAIHPILKNQSRLLSGYRYHGFGKIGFHLLQETYRLMLRGDSLAYALLWSTVVEEISRSAIKESTIWQQKANFPLYPDTPVVIEIISSANEPDVFLNDIKIPVEENVLMDDLWKAKFWTDREGWNHISIAGDTVLDLYTSNKHEWQSLAAANALENTLRTASSTQPEKKLTKIFLPVPRGIFYLMFLVGAGFLWLVPKL